jgi:hypothetical protein
MLHTVIGCGNLLSLRPGTLMLSEYQGSIHWGFFVAVFDSERSLGSCCCSIFSSSMPKKDHAFVKCQLLAQQNVAYNV